MVKTGNEWSQTFRYYLGNNTEFIGTKTWNKKKQNF